MKWICTTLMLGAALFFMQVGVAANSFSNNHALSEADSSLQMSCHHHSAGMTMDNGAALYGSSNITDDSCCQVNCQCSVASCSAPSVIVTTATVTQNISTSIRDVFVFYVVDIPQTLNKSLFRPPIYS